ncbi:hypothetical protein AGMMS49587_07080 [Spirochaetia bacterium]|nr:hypothetical protein AGMMS49587_07080 [Spirochaetia bacterium]
MDRYVTNKPVQKTGDRNFPQAVKHGKEGPLAVNQQGLDFALSVLQNPYMIMEKGTVQKPAAGRHTKGLPFP